MFWLTLFPLFMPPNTILFIYPGPEMFEGFEDILLSFMTPFLPFSLSWSMPWRKRTTSFLFILPWSEILIFDNLIIKSKFCVETFLLPPHYFQNGNLPLYVVCMCMCVTQNPFFLLNNQILYRELPLHWLGSWAGWLKTDVYFLFWNSKGTESSFL